MLYIDCGHTVGGAAYTGIQRYVRHTLRHAHALLGPRDVRAISAGASGWTCLPSLPAHALEGLPPVALKTGTPCFDADAHVLLADRFWHTGAWDALDALLASEAQITAVVYDLLSLTQPGWFSTGVGERFGRYLAKVLPRANRVVCLSADVASHLTAWARTRGFITAPVSVIAPGHQVWSGAALAPPSLPAAWCDGRTPFVLQVGTLEPRKNHGMTLEAVQRQWASGRELGCLFIGQHGWGVEPLLNDMAKLPQWQRDLLWLPECTDAELAWCYRHAAAVCYPSADEGYGLPLAEAASAGAPVIASDTAVHREVAASLRANSGVRLFELAPGFFHEALTQALACPSGQRPLASAGRTWRTATAELLQVAVSPVEGICSV